METNIKGEDNTTSANGSRLNQSSLTQHFGTQKPYIRNLSLAIHSSVVVAVVLGFGFVLIQLDKVEKQIEKLFS